MHPDKASELQQQISDAHNVKAVMNSKGWKETCEPLIRQHREEFIAQVRQNFWNTDPTIPAKVMWFICGIDAVLQLFANAEEAGRLAKEALQNQTDTAPQG